MLISIFCELVLALILLLLQNSASQTEGWRMIDRFHGFRYEISGDNNGLLFEDYQKRADLESCFGWIQKSKRGTLVGEARCAKPNGKRLEHWLRTNSHDINILVRNDCNEVFLLF